jgi:sRNA-binding protein
MQATAKAVAEAARARNAAVTALERRLRADAPAVFGDRPVPLAIGIDRALAALLAGEVSGKTISRFLARWTGRAAYLRAIAGGGSRFDLAGNPAGLVTADQRENAAAALANRAAEGLP